MKTTVPVVSLLALFLLGCSTPKNPSVDYSWNVSVTRTGNAAYELNADLAMTCERLGSGTKAVQRDTLHMPTLTLTPGLPAETTVSDGEDDAVLVAKGLLQTNGEEKTVSYEMMIKEDGLTHRTKGLIEMQ